MLKSQSGISARTARTLPVLVLFAALSTTLPYAGSAPPQPATARAQPAQTALDRYVAAPDANFSWRVARELPAEGVTATLIEMTSQQWLTDKEVERPLWTHWITVVRPAAAQKPTGEGGNVTSDIGLLFIGGGSNDRPPPARPAAWLVDAARDTGTVTAELRLVPNQPVVFKDDPSRKPRTEDDFIAYTWDKFLRTGDEKWPARLPMTKSAVRAMDAITAFTATEAGGGKGVTRFVVSGASKRGWTTWTTAATDRRVIAIAPAVIDMLNVEPSFVHHWRVYGAWSDAVKDYVDHRIMNWMGTPEFRALMKIEEPYEYRDRLTMPKFMLNASGDQFFLPDSSQFYFDDLLGEKHLRYVPNASHSLDKTDALESLQAFYSTIVKGTAPSHVHLDVRARRVDQGRGQGPPGGGADLAGRESDRQEFPSRRHRVGVQQYAADAFRTQHLCRARTSARCGMDRVFRRAEVRERRKVSPQVHDRRSRFA